MTWKKKIAGTAAMFILGFIFILPRCRAPSVSDQRESSERTGRGTQDLRSDISGAGW